MRIQACDLRAKSRNLEQVIPLDMPYALFIDPSNLCNCQCVFCPTGDRKLRAMRANGIMSLELFKKIVNDLREFPRRLKRVNLYKDGEPLVNRHFPEMVAYLKQADITDTVWTKTNGLLLTPQLNTELIDAGLDMIGISVKQVTANGYKNISKVEMDYGRFLDNLEDLYARRGDCRIYISIADSGLASDEIDKFYDDFDPISDYIAVEKLHGWSMSSIKDFTLGIHSDTFDGIPLVPKIVCPWAFYELGVNWNGTVGICNEDWAHKTIVGDANKESLVGIWNGAALRNMQLMMLEGRRSENDACRDCYYLMCSPDNLDICREKILEKFNDR